MEVWASNILKMLSIDERFELRNNPLSLNNFLSFTRKFWQSVTPPPPPHSHFHPYTGQIDGVSVEVMGNSFYRQPRQHSVANSLPAVRNPSVRQQSKNSKAFVEIAVFLTSRHFLNFPSKIILQGTSLTIKQIHINALGSKSCLTEHKTRSILSPKIELRAWWQGLLPTEPFLQTVVLVSKEEYIFSIVFRHCIA